MLSDNAEIVLSFWIYWRCSKTLQKQ